MTTLRLRTADRTAMYDALRDAGLLISDEDGEERLATGVVDLGQDPRTLDGYDESGEEPVPLWKTHTGYHVDVLTDDPAVIDALSPLAVTPATPMHKFAGADL